MPQTRLVRGRDFIALTRIKANVSPSILFSFLFFRHPVHPPGSISPLFFFSHVIRPPAVHRRRVSARPFEIHASDAEGSRWHKDIPTTIKKSLDSAALLLVRASTLKRKTLRLPFSVRHPRCAGSHYRVRSRFFHSCDTRITLATAK